MPDWVVAAIVFVIPLIALAGAAQWRIGRAERDQDELKKTVEALHTEVNALKADVARARERLHSFGNEVQAHEGRDVLAFEKLEGLMKELRTEMLHGFAELRAAQRDDTNPRARRPP